MCPLIESQRCLASLICVIIFNQLCFQERARGAIETEQLGLVNNGATLGLVNNGARTGNLPVSKSDIFIYSEIHTHIHVYLLVCVCMNISMCMFIWKKILF